MYSHYSLF
ncbi:hypothetical protein RDI58_021615 [Solanum bulbocastanum]|uniref:Uncharacterized protein n=1 Tax=Solanum bulbocastanum TaxID=147425 RepID=A0AAN8T6B7_SOLBU